MSEDKRRTITIAIGDISIRLTASTDADAFELGPEYKSFVFDGEMAEEPADVSLEVLYKNPSPVVGATEIFDTGSNWSLLQADDTYYIPMQSPVLEPRLFKMLEINEDFTRGTIRIADPVRDTHSEFDESQRHCPIQYPLDELLMVNLLSRGRGIELHGLGVDAEGSGLVFSGTSGAGKSTLAELWKQRPGVMILSDDRIIVRESSPELFSCRGDAEFAASADYFLYGTPWHGDAAISAYGGVPLKRIMVLEQADENVLVELSPADATAALLVRCFPTFWDAAGMQFTMDFIVELCSMVPCYTFRFRPEPEALDTVLDSL